jgi:alpha-mannosidase
VSGGGVSAAVIPLDGPLMTFGDINRGLWPEKFEPRSAALFGYALNNYWHTNFPKVQSGEFTFRYVVTSGADLSAAALSRLGREAMTPLEVGELTHNDKVDATRGSLPMEPSGFLGVAGDGFEMETLKPAEDGNGNVIRLLETAGRGGSVRISSKLVRIERAWLCNAAEDNEREIPLAGNAIEVALKPYSIVTVRALLRPVQ